MNQDFNDWLYRHPCSKETLWYIQNCLLSCLGDEHPLSVDATKAWQKMPYPNEQ